MFTLNDQEIGVLQSDSIMFHHDILLHQQEGDWDGVNRARDFYNWHYAFTTYVSRVRRYERDILLLFQGFRVRHGLMPIAVMRELVTRINQLMEWRGLAERLQVPDLLGPNPVVPGVVVPEPVDQEEDGIIVMDILEDDPFDLLYDPIVPLFDEN